MREPVQSLSEPGFRLHRDGQAIVVVVGEETYELPFDNVEWATYAKERIAKDASAPRKK
jgi:hypothetical protein